MIIGSVKKLDALLDEIEADALKAIEYDRLAEEMRQRVRAKLPKARALGAGPSLLERRVHSLFVTRTISRWTAGSAPQDKPTSTRKRPGAGADGS